MKLEQVADETHPYIQELIKSGTHQTKVCGRRKCTSMTNGGIPLVNDPENGWRCPSCGEEYHITKGRVNGISA